MSKKIESSSAARKITVPVFELTSISDEFDPAAVRVDLPAETYFIAAKLLPEEGKRRDGKPNWVKHQFNVFPIVLDQNGVPWAEANIYLLTRIENTLNPNMTTFAGLADDLVAFRSFMDESELDYMYFPAPKLFRPTYRFSGYLKIKIYSGEISASTATRRMSTVVGFYRWLMSEFSFIPDHQIWKESDQYIQFTDGHGIKQSKKVTITDVNLKISKTNDPYDGSIDDGGKLKPLRVEEQEWLVNALIKLGNTEMTLIHLFSMLTGARIQTTLTLRRRDFEKLLSEEFKGEVRLPVGPGTGIDTKRDKLHVLHIPAWLYRQLTTYAASQRAKQRRLRANGGDHENQYLFLSQRGAPLYQSKEELLRFNPNNKLRHQKVGQGVRQFIIERVLPHVRSSYAPGFLYQFHDLRATAGMNWTDRQLSLVGKGEVTLHEARQFVQVRMGHSSSAVTDRYLQFRRNLKMVRHIQSEHEIHLMTLAASVMDGVS